MESEIPQVFAALEKAAKTPSTELSHSVYETMCWYCAFLLHNWNVLVISDTGKLVADFLTDVDGSFHLNLKPGTYVLTAYYPDFGPYQIVWGTSVEVTIAKKGVETVFLPVTLPPL